MKLNFALGKEAESLIRAMTSAPRRWAKIRDSAMKTVATQCAKDVVAVIMSQSFPNVRLSAAWLARKEKAGTDTRTLMETQRYMKSIRAVKSGAASWAVAAEKSDIGEMLEDGTSKMPPRPHWRPVLLRYQIRFAEYFAKDVMAQLFSQEE